jgi:nitrite reductase (cytochrome c-552)
MISTDNTLRPALRANCFACKSANYPAVRDYMGIEFYSTPFEELRDLMTQPVSCFNCHGNEPGDPTVMAHYLKWALGDYMNEVSMASASCAQCHIEYHFDQVNWEVVVPWGQMINPNMTLEDSMYPTNILANFNNTTDEHIRRVGHDGEDPFADFTNPRSGVRLVKVQHPEFETLYGRYAVHNSLAPNLMARSCADCHMPPSEAEDGTPYISHNWTSPLNNMQMLQGDCFACHGDNLVTEVREIQAMYVDRLHSPEGLGPRLADQVERLVLAVESGEFSDEELREIRETFRSAQFFWDFAISENSNGAHNSRLIFQVIDYGFEQTDLIETQLVELGF